MRKINKLPTIIWILLFLLVFNFLSPVSALALSIAIHVPEKYTDVEAGERFYFEMEIKYPENPIRRDLILQYEIKKDGEIIAQSKFLKAIETQASFMDFIVIPESTDKGLYIINVTIRDYEGLEEEVSASFQVTGGRRAQLRIYFLIFLSAFSFVALLIMIQLFMTRVITKGHLRHLSSHEYSNVPKNDRLFYEIISDTIMQMRHRVGDKALELALNIDGLSINDEGRVLKINKNPAKIIALLILQYEKQLGKKVSFALRETNQETKKRLTQVDRNLVLIRKYFE